MQFCQTVHSIPAHDDAVSCISYVSEIGVLVSGSWDCSVKLWKGFTTAHSKSFRLADSILGYFNCDDKITCLDSRLLADCGNINVVIGTEAGGVFIWAVNQKMLPMDRGCEPATSNSVLELTKTRRLSQVTGLAFSDSGERVACCDALGHLVVYFIHDVTAISSSCDNIVLLFEEHLGTELSGMSWAFGRSQLVLTDAGGMLYVWNMEHGKAERKLALHSGGISALCRLDDRRFVTAGKDAGRHCVKVWKCDGGE